MKLVELRSGAGVIFINPSHVKAVREANMRAVLDMTDKTTVNLDDTVQEAVTKLNLGLKD